MIAGPGIEGDMEFTRITINPWPMGGVACLRGLRRSVATTIGLVVGPCRSRPRHATARLKLLEGLQILLPVLHVVSVVPDMTTLEQAIELEPMELEQLARLIVRERARSVALDRQCLEASRAAFRRWAKASGSSTVIFMESSDSRNALLVMRH
jgi:hypothetical protein